MNVSTEPSRVLNGYDTAADLTVVKQYLENGKGSRQEVAEAFFRLGRALQGLQTESALQPRTDGQVIAALRVSLSELFGQTPSFQVGASIFPEQDAPDNE